MHPRVVPSPSPIFVGREAELTRLEEALARVSVAVICGVGGVGKSAIAYALAAGWPHPVVYRKAAAEPLSTLVNDVRRQLAREPAGDLATDEERLADLAARLDAERCLWVVDDLHLLAPAARTELLRGLGQALRHGRVIGTSRERIPVGAGDPDRLEIAIEGLDDSSARALWRSLDELYGPAAGFETAWARSRGNPFLLRRAHAGGLEDEDPVAAAVQALGPDERRIAGALALAGRRLPSTLLMALLPGDRGRAALRRLMTLLLADLDGAGSCGMHDLFREAVLAELAAPLRADLHASLARLLPDAGLDVVVRVREVVRHLRAIERDDEAGTYLIKHSAELVHDGATAELLAGLDAIPAASGVRAGPELAVARARCLANLLQTVRAYEELERLAAPGPSRSATALAAFAELALTRGALDVAEGAIAELLADPALPDALALPTRVLQAMALTLRGRGDDAARLLAAEETRATDTTAAMHLAFTTARLRWLDERDHDADEALQRAAPLLPSNSTLPFDPGVLVPMAFAAVHARLGRGAEVDEFLRRADASATTLDPSTELYVRRMRAGIAYERGERAEALAALRQVADAYERASLTLSALLIRPWVGRILLVIGRRDEGLRVLDETARRAEPLGLGVVLRAVEESRRHDPLARIAAPLPPGDDGGAIGWRRGEVVRTRALRALRAAAAGEGAEARGLVAANVRDAGGAGYALDRALGHLARATLARLEGRGAEATREEEQAIRVAAEDGVDSRLIPALQEAVGRLRVVTGGSSWVAREVPADRGAYDVLIDGSSHELHSPGKIVSFKTRPILRRLLYTLASRPNDPFAKETLVSRVWSQEYNPMIHDNSLWVNVRRLRLLLDDTGLAIEVAENGYSLKVPARFLYVDPSG